MALNYQSVFNDVIRHIPELGVEKSYLDLGEKVGPQNPLWMEGATLYEIYVRSFSQEGTFTAVSARLPDLKQMGIDVVWLMPVYPIGIEGRKGTLGSPYAIRDYFDVNPEYGSKADFKELIFHAHQLDMHVLIDMVPNHVAPDFKELKQQPNLVVRDEQGRPQRKVPDWTDVIDLNYNDKATWAFMAQVMTFWIEEFDVDGFRCDVAGLVPLDFWSWVIPQLRSIKSDFYLLAEWESPRLHETGFNSTYDWSTRRLLTLALKKEIPLKLLADWIVTKTAIYPKQSLPLRFLENHDLPRARQVFPQEQFFAALTLQYTLHGVPLLYNGQEMGAFHSLSLFEKENIEWDKVDRRIFETTKHLIRLRKTEAALGSKQYYFFEEALDHGIFAFNKENDLRVIINLTSNEQALEPPWGSGLHTVLFDSQSLISTKKMLKKIKPFQAIVAKF